MRGGFALAIVSALVKIMRRITGYYKPSLKQEISISSKFQYLAFFPLASMA